VAHNKAFNFISIAAKKKLLQKLVTYEMIQRTENNAEEILANKEYQLLLPEALEQLSPQKIGLCDATRIGA